MFYLPNAGPLLEPPEDSIRKKFLPALLNRTTLNDQELELLALPARHSGMGLVNLTTLSDEHATSRAICELLVSNIIGQRCQLGMCLKNSAN